MTSFKENVNISNINCLYPLTQVHLIIQTEFVKFRNLNVN